MKFALQICCRRERAIPVVFEWHVPERDLPCSAEHPASPLRRRPRRHHQGHRAAERRRVQLAGEHAGAVGGEVPAGHRRADDGDRAVPEPERRALHRQHLPLPEPVRQRQLPARLRLLRRHDQPRRRHQRHPVHQRVRRQLRHARVGAGRRRRRGPPRRRRRGRVANRRRQARQGGPRAAVLRRAAPEAGVQRRDAAAAEPVRGGVPVQPRRRGRQERGAGQLRAPLGHPPVRRPAQVRHGPRRAGPGHGARGGARRRLPPARVVRAQPERHAGRHEQGRRQRQLRLHVRRLHLAGLRLDVQRHGRRRQRLLRLQRLLPGAEPGGGVVRLPGPRRADAAGPVHECLQLHHTDRAVCGRRPTAGRGGRDGGDGHADLGSRRHGHDALIGVRT
uniref:Uncharacterized protein n=1 Tax=Oryza nivara TaxID=4536 RepID=A0A0E0GR93_ORYNI